MVCTGRNKEISRLKKFKKTLDIFAFSYYNIQVIQTHGGIAQLGERLNGIQEVSGSIPLISTIYGISYELRLGYLAV